MSESEGKLENAMNNSKILKKLAVVLLIPIGIILVHFSSTQPALVEALYSEKLYRVIGQPISLITGIFPFSLAELIVFFVPAAIVIYTLTTAIKFFFHARGSISKLLNYILNLLMFVSIAFFLFISIWGLNYYRLPFASIAGLDVRPSSVVELEEVCEVLISNANALRSKVSQDSDGVMDIKENKRQILKRCIKGYERASLIYPQLGGKYGTPKPVYFSRLMSYTGISGIYFPFTAEANVNVDVPDSMIPCTASHEMAHQRGFAREDEANYIAYLTCVAHPDADFQYSGTLLALINAMNALYNGDSREYFKLSEGYSDGIVRDLKAIDAYWKQYEGPVEKTSDRINNAYL
ncbi:MAG: DUF3810 domain-containing protein, partial [Caulobacteraceae bacterium]